MSFSPQNHGSIPSHTQGHRIPYVEDGEDDDDDNEESEWDSARQVFFMKIINKKEKNEKGVIMK